MLSRRTLAAASLAVTLGGCSSSTPGFAAAPDTGGDAQIADTATTPDVEAAADTSGRDAPAEVAADAAPEAADDGDASAMDALEAGAVDATPDVAPETPADPLVLEQHRCESGAPRLYWMPGKGCFDSAPPAGVLVSPAPCAFARHADGSLRCLPIARGPVVAYPGWACSPDATFVATPLLPGADINLPMLGIVDEAGGAHVRRGHSVRTPSAFYVMQAGACTLATGLYIWSTPSNLTFAALEEVPASSFVATSL